MPIFKLAMGDGLVTINPTTGLENPVCKTPPAKRVISVDSIVRAQMVLEIRDRLIFRLAVCEGMRPGEIMALKVGDFRADGMLHIERRVYRGSVAEPKSVRSRRNVPPTELTLLLLQQWQELLIDTSSEAWLFPSEAGSTPLSYANVYRRRIQPALAKVGLGTVNFQVLRRTWVTECAGIETDPNIRAQLAGHSVDVHENTYRQAQPEALKRTMRKMGKHLQ